MCSDSISKFARGVTWGIFLLVSLATAGISVVPDSEFHLPGIFQAALFFSGVSVVGVAEFYIQRYELSSTRSPGALFLVLFALPFTYFYISGASAHSEQAIGWAYLGVWLLVFVGPISFFQHSRLETYLLAGLGVFLIAACVLLLVLCIWLWPKIYYEYLRPAEHLDWTPYFMVIVGLIFWGALVEVGRRIRNSIQQALKTRGTPNRLFA